MIKIECLNVAQGDKEMFVKDTTPEERAELASTVLGLIKKGFLMFLIEGTVSRQIQGYEQESNQWLLTSDTMESPPSTPDITQKKTRGRPRKNIEKVSAENTQVTAVGPTAGG